jgi:hypothetical protein
MNELKIFKMALPLPMAEAYVNIITRNKNFNKKNFFIDKSSKILYILIWKLKWEETKLKKEANVKKVLGRC